MADGHCALFDDIQHFQTGRQFTSGAGVNFEFALRHGLHTLGNRLGAAKDRIQGWRPTCGHLPFNLGQA